MAFGLNTSKASRDALIPLDISLDYGGKRDKGYTPEFRPCREKGKRRKSPVVLLSTGLNTAHAGLVPLDASLDSGTKPDRGRKVPFRSPQIDRVSHTTAFNTSKAKLEPLSLSLDYGTRADRNWKFKEGDHRPLARFNGTNAPWVYRQNYHRRLRNGQGKGRRRPRKKKSTWTTPSEAPGKELTRLEIIDHPNGMRIHGTGLATFGGADYIKPLDLSLDFGEPRHDKGFTPEFNALARHVTPSPPKTKRKKKRKTHPSPWLAHIEEQERQERRERDEWEERGDRNSGRRDDEVPRDLFASPPPPPSDPESDPEPEPEQTVDPGLGANADAAGVSPADAAGGRPANAPGPGAAAVGGADLAADGSPAGGDGGDGDGGVSADPLDGGSGGGDDDGDGAPPRGGRSSWNPHLEMD